MGIILWIIVGILAGFIAEKVTKSNHGLLTNLIVGLLGAVIGGWLASALNLSIAPGFLGTLIVASIGAILLLLVLQAVKR